MKKLFQQHTILFVSWGLVLATLVVYWPLHNAEFINLDDPFIIYNNGIVNQGWTVAGFGWALTTSYFEYWHPLTWLSHMTDCQFFGLAANWHHLVSLGFHLVNTLLVFAIFREMTGKQWRSAMVAALFALHPMHVESVAWLSERKDVLSTFFWLLTIMAYVKYYKALQLKRPVAEFFYRLALMFFIGGIMSKPMVVTLPFVLLLLDFWPLDRFNALFCRPENSSATKIFFSILKDLMREKAPFFGLMIFACAITFSSVKQGNNLISADVIPWSLRLTNVPVSYARYIAKMFWPVNMSVQYPLPVRWGFWQVLLSVVILLIVSGIALRKIRTAPYIFCGWCIFLGTLVPTMSLVPVGYQAMADRYTYISYLGLFAALVWLGADFFERHKYRLLIPGFATVVILAGYGFTTFVQAGYWQNNFTLWPHCLAVTTGNFSACYNYGFALQAVGRFDESIAQYREALRIRPKYMDALLNLGRELAVTGKLQEASQYFADAIRTDPSSSRAHQNLGMVLFELGDYPRSEKECAESARLDPTAIMPLIFLGRAQSKEGKLDQAAESFDQVLKLHPSNAEEHYFLAKEFFKLGRRDEAISHLSEAVRLNPTWAQARAELQTALSQTSTITLPAENSSMH